MASQTPNRAEGSATPNRIRVVAATRSDENASSAAPAASYRQPSGAESTRPTARQRLAQSATR